MEGDRVEGAGDPGQRVLGGQGQRSDAGIDAAVRMAGGGADQLPAQPLRGRVPHLVRGDRQDALAEDVLAAQVGAEDLVGQDHDLELDVMALDVRGGIRFGVPELLRFGDGRRKLDALFEAAQDVVRGAVHDTLDAGDLKAAEHALGGAQDGGAAEDRALELEADTTLGSQLLQCAAGECDRSLVGGAHMLARLQSPAHMRKGRLAVGGIGERRLHDDVGRDLTDHPLVARIRTTTGQAREVELPGLAGQQRRQIDAVGVHQGTGPQIGDRHHPQGEAQLLGQALPALGYELGKRAIDATEADEGEIVSAHEIAPSQSAASTVRLLKASLSGLSPAPCRNDRTACRSAPL